VEADNPFPDDQSGAAESALRLNYFNYFTEVEEEFVRRRGKPLTISPLDWALVESWKDAGIPLHIVLRAINRSFDAYDARPRQFRRVNTIFYCQQEVEASFAEYRLAQVGGPAAESPPEQSEPPPSGGKKRTAAPLPVEVLRDFLNRCDEELRLAGESAERFARNELSESIARARSRLARIADDVAATHQVEAQAVERDFDSLDRMLFEAAIAALKEDERAAIRKDAETQLRPHRKKMEKGIYEQTLENFVARRIRETHHLPRLSLFYL
jgi:hypothetical protein